jgi:spermidine/putrescine transport system ATP-binding protein
MHGKDVVLDGMSITYPNGFTAVQATDLTIAAGEFFSILGPSGCGKTTILRAVSGFLEPSAGRVLIGTEDQVGRGPNLRPTALIFQNLALFPLMRVWENVAFGLEARGVPRRARRERAMELLELVALSVEAEKKPIELSGGQRQRVAVARALAVEPAVLLLDEPLSALDLKLRSHMRAELRAIQKKTGVTFIYITHDQGEMRAGSSRSAPGTKSIPARSPPSWRASWVNPTCSAAASPGWRMVSPGSRPRRARSGARTSPASPPVIWRWCSCAPSMCASRTRTPRSPTRSRPR